MRIYAVDGILLPWRNNLLDCSVLKRVRYRRDVVCDVSVMMSQGDGECAGGGYPTSPRYS